MEFGIYVTGAGRGIIPSKDHYPPAKHPTMYAFNYSQGRILPEFQMIIISDGKGIFESEQTGETSIKPGTLILLFPDIWHRYKPDEQTGWKERWISFNGVIIHQLMEQGYLNPSRAIHQLSDPEYLIFTFDHFLDRIHLKPTENNVVTSLSAMALLSEIIDLIGTGMTGTRKHFNSKSIYSKDELVDSVLEIIWTQSHRPISVDSILTQVPASRRTLERRFQKIHGHSIYEEIMQCRLNRAKRLLRETRLPIKTVAYLSGFSCPDRMRRSFERFLAQPPSEFRNQNSLDNISDE
ncbi:MAG: helix-turn-helix domain-containing protein [Sedimentisphaerales bacterium]|nr:helix-turn-helix domain-containing protein [Sedimentisphaerales bacterium]